MEGARIAALRRRSHQCRCLRLGERDGEHSNRSRELGLSIARVPETDVRLQSRFEAETNAGLEDHPACRCTSPSSIGFAIAASSTGHPAYRRATGTRADAIESKATIAGSRFTRSRSSDVMSRCVAIVSDTSMRSRSRSRLLRSRCVAHRCCAGVSPTSHAPPITLRTGGAR